MASDSLAFYKERMFTFSPAIDRDIAAAANAILGKDYTVEHSLTAADILNKQAQGELHIPSAAASFLQPLKNTADEKNEAIRTGNQQQIVRLQRNEDGGSDCFSAITHQRQLTALLWNPNDRDFHIHTYGKTPELIFSHDEKTHQTQLKIGQETLYIPKEKKITLFCHEPAHNVINFSQYHPQNRVPLNFTLKGETPVTIKYSAATQHTHLSAENSFDASMPTLLAGRTRLTWIGHQKHPYTRVCDSQITFGDNTINMESHFTNYTLYNVNMSVSGTSVPVYKQGNLELDVAENLRNIVPSTLSHKQNAR